MARTYTVEVGGIEYKGDTAPAKDQFESLHIAMRTGLVAHLRDEPSEMALVAMMGGLTYDDVKRLVQLLVSNRIQRAEDSVPVAENLFGDNIQDYYVLIGRAVQENLGNFWKLHRPNTKPVAVEPKQ